jgi:cysteine synthase B
MDTWLRDQIQKYPALGLIGNTPLVRVDLFSEELPDVAIFAKIESFNPGGSVKDRPVMRMLLEGIRAGHLTPEKTILDSSSGNAGIAYASIGGLLGYKVKIVMPDNVSTERKQRIKSHGAELLFTEGVSGYDEAMRTCHRLYEENPNQYFFSNQYENDWNWKAHYDTTAAEILSQTDGHLTHFVVGVGTGGTITGVGRRLKEANPNIKIISVLPDNFPGIEGLKPLRGPNDIRPKILDELVIDEWLDVTADDAFNICQRLAKRGLFVGQSSGAFLYGAYQVAKREKVGTLVTLFPDIGERYFSSGLWEDLDF